MNAGLIVIILLLVLSILGIPIYLALGIGTLVALNMADMPFIVLPQKLFAGMNSSSLLAIPFFMLAGNIMSRSITGKLIDVSNALIGWIKGSLAVVTVLASALFGAISGSGVATASAVGGTTIPAMKEEGYPDHFAAAISGIAAILGPIIPPSITLIVYASITDLSVSKLFVGSVIPGILMAVGLIIYALFYGKKNDLPAHERKSAKEVLLIFKDSIWALLMPVIILGGIYGGIFTPTEAAAVSVIYSIIVGCVIYRELDLKKLIQCTKNACETTASILIVIGCAAGFSKVLTLGRIPTTVASAMMSLTDSKIVILLLINVLLLIVGCFMETLCAIMILAPILYPVVTAMGVDVTHFGIIMVVNLAIGFITPPLGVNLFVASRVGETTLDTVIKGIIPFLILMIVTLLCITYIPAISMFLPNLMG